LSYILEQESKKDYTHFTVSGKDSVEVSLAYMREIFEICREQKITRVFIEESLEGQLSPTQMFEVTSRFSEMTRGLSVRVAHYDTHADHAQDNAFGETVARNRGVELRTFSDENSALNWLLS